MKQYFELGKILKPQGIKGEIKLKPYSDDLSKFSDLERVYFKNGDVYESVVVIKARTYKHFAYLALHGCEDRNAAELLRNKTLYIKREQAAKPEEGQHFLVDLEGLELSDENGIILGIVDNIMNTGAADIYNISGENNFMFAAAPGVILEVTKEKIVVDSKRLDEVAVYD